MPANKRWRDDTGMYLVIQRKKQSPEVIPFRRFYPEINGGHTEQPSERIQDHLNLTRNDHPKGK
jgi:hypothetical protein